MNSVPCRLIGHGILFLVRPAPILSLASGFFWHKLKPDGTLDRYKAHWVLRGFTQRAGVDYGETFSPVVKPAIVRTVLSIVVAHDWPVHQLDINNAFLYGTPAETVYCAQPSGFVDVSQPKNVCRLNKSLYGLKQVPVHGTSVSLTIFFDSASSALARIRRSSSTPAILRLSTYCYMSMI